MRVAICDDDLGQVKMLVAYLEQYRARYPEMRLSTYSSGEALMKAFHHGAQFDILFLDIVLGGMNGIQVAEEIRQKDPDTILLFISNYTDFVFNVFVYNAFQYLVKPITHGRFEEEFERAVKTYQLKHAQYLIKWEHTVTSLEIGNILFIEGYHRHIMVHSTHGDTYQAVGKLRDEERRLIPYGFVRSHQGFLINMHFIREIGNKFVYLKNGERVDLSARKRTAVLEQYHQFIARCSV